jgi:hypothetical protein
MKVCGSISNKTLNYIFFLFYLQQLSKSNFVYQNKKNLLIFIEF